LEENRRMTASAEARKVVTVLFTDITGSTTLGETLDPESLRGVLSQYFSEMQAVIERHEGVVEKFVGDAIMAVFGIPVTHEDDALRAVRAAAEMRARLEELNEEFASTWGVTIGVRTGVNTGEVLTAEPGRSQQLVLGDAVNTAARLEQAAEAGEILIGDGTYRLVHDAVTTERVTPLDLKGKAQPVPAWRLVAVTADGPGWARRLDSVLVGREQELAQLHGAFQRVTAHPSCEVVTVVGVAGVGKSRLTAEFVEQLGPRATVLRGRCLPYGEGITFWPVAAMVMDAIGMEERESIDEARRRISELLGDDERACGGITSLLGAPTGEVGIQETSWAVRVFLERIAQRGPVVVVFDDIHWGESTFLDLLDYLGDRVEAPVLIVCESRPELLDDRPRWPAAVSLGPLSGDDTDGLIRGLVGDVPADARGRITEVTEGNPLFVEETLRMLIDDGVLRHVDGDWVVDGDLSSIAIPPTILALLGARLDRLEPAQRTVIERASVVGREFWWGAVSALSPSEVQPHVGRCLHALVRKELIRAERSEVRGEDAFRFTHILVRDAAYGGLPKSTRAELHERLAGWLDATSRDLAGEYEEIVGYHLEQAHRMRLDLAPPSERSAELAERAAERLGSAGGRALARGDMPAAVNLLSRATALLPGHHPRRLELLPELAFALLEAADFDRLVEVADEMRQTSGDPHLQAHATVIGLWIRLFTDPDGWAPEAEREAHRAIDTFGRLGDERGLARAWSLLALVSMMRSLYAPAHEAWSHAVEHAGRAGNRRDVLEGLTWVAAVVWLGPAPAEEGIRSCREVFDRAQGDRKAMATALFCEAGLRANLGHFEDASGLFADARALLEEVGLPVWDAGALSQALGWALLLEGRPDAAEQELRRAYETLAAIGEVSFLSTVAGILAEAIYAQGRCDEAEHFTRVSEETASADDVFSQVLWRSVRAKCLARAGDAEAASRTADECIRLVEATDCLDLHRHALMSQAEVHELLGRRGDAEAAVRAAIGVAERKQNLVGVRLGLEVLDGARR
jgi:class 3 adenylate cyclase/tetratricopeptide (TPR) repeat protein